MHSNLPHWAPATYLTCYAAEWWKQGEATLPINNRMTIVVPLDSLTHSTQLLSHFPHGYFYFYPFPLPRLESILSIYLTSSQYIRDVTGKGETRFNQQA
jgi:hypothetical protein